MLKFIINNIQWVQVIILWMLVGSSLTLGLLAKWKDIKASLPTLYQLLPALIIALTFIESILLMFY